MVIKRGLQAGRLPLLLLPILFALFIINIGYTQETSIYPKPVSEYVEMTSSSSMTFLSYPKYYRDDEDTLQETVTAIIPSEDPNWDYQVTTGIWHLYIRNDGYFQAQHKGDIFTYRLNSLGYGRGSGFRSVDLGSPDFNRMEVSGDTVLWRDVFADVDLSVRYIHHILKVDVILRKEFMRDVKAVVVEGSIPTNDYLTARFDIDLVEVNSIARQDGEERDLYAEQLTLDSPLRFEQDGKTVHSLRPVEVYRLGEDGAPVFDFANPVRTRQTWQLLETNDGIAEMSAFLEDLVKLPDGDVVLDPSTTFDEDSTTTKDTRLAPSGGPYGSNSLVSWGDDDRLLFGFNVSNLPDDLIVNEAKLKIRAYESLLGAMEEVDAKAYKVTTSWVESTVTGSGSPWNTDGGHDNGVSSAAVQLPVDDDVTFEFDVTGILQSHLGSSESDVYDKGFLLKMEDSTANSLLISMNDYGTSLYLPKLEVDFNYVHEITFYEGASNGYPTNAIIDAHIASSNAAIQNDDGGGDYAANATIVRNGSLSNLGDILFVESPEELADVYDLLDTAAGDHKCYFVLTFDHESWGGAKHGYGWFFDKYILLTNEANSNTPILAHELGHNFGLHDPPTQDHICSTLDPSCLKYLMSATITASSNVLISDHKNAFEN